MPVVDSELTAGLFIDGEWTAGAGADAIEVVNPFDQTLLATLPIASEDEVDRAIAAAARAAREPLTPSERYDLLTRTCALVEERAEEFAQTIVAEVGKPLRDSRVEVERGIQTLRLCAEEAKRIKGEMVPFDGTPGSEHRMGFTMRLPIGPVCAITPFNAPLIQVSHKVPTALAAGCSVVLKPSEKAALSAIKLFEALIEAGLPAGYANLLQGTGDGVGAQLLADPRFAAYSFTGSVAIGEHIRRSVGLRKTLLELGNNAPNIVHSDADIEHAAAAIAKSAYTYAGQLCISAQRILVHRSVAHDFVDALTARVSKLKVGDPALEETDIGPMISDAAAERAQAVIEAAVADGARLAAGGRRDGRLFEPTVLVGAEPEMGIMCDEAFAPVVAVATYDTVEEAAELANSTRYGLQAAVFTSTIDAAFDLAKRIEFGTVIVNEGSATRVDQMPFGGVKQSGMGREGVRYAIEEFTEPRLVVFGLRPAPAHSA